jgi:hypothetical protein
VRRKAEYRCAKRGQHRAMCQRDRRAAAKITPAERQPIEKNEAYRPPAGLRARPVSVK